MKQTKALISIWDLLCTFQEHRKAVVKAPVGIQVTDQFKPKEVVNFIQNEEEGAITFYERDISKEGRNHNKPLFIRAEVGGRKVSCVMVDDGSSINVCPLKFLKRLDIQAKDL